MRKELAEIVKAEIMEAAERFYEKLIADDRSCYTQELLLHDATDHRVHILIQSLEIKT